MRLKNKFSKIVFILFSSLIISAFAKQVSAEVRDTSEAREAVARQHYLKGRGYYQEGDYQKAQEEFNKALAAISEGEKTPQYLEKAAKQEKAGKPQEAHDLLYTYTIGVGDVLNIAVWQEEKLNLDVTVRPDGKISYPLIGDIAAFGLTLTELNEEITNRLKEYIRYPEVTISVKRMGGQKVVVLGEVAWPGVYYVTGKRTVLEAIALANGFTSHAVPSSVIVIRGRLQKPQGKRINLSKAIVNNDFSENIMLEEEDIIYVPKKFIANVNYFVNTFVSPLTGQGKDGNYLRNARW